MATFADCAPAAGHLVLQALAGRNSEREGAPEWSLTQLAGRCTELCGKPSQRQAVSATLRATLEPKGLVVSRSEGARQVVWTPTELVRAAAARSYRAAQLTLHTGPPRGAGAGWDGGAGARRRRVRAEESARRAATTSQRNAAAAGCRCRRASVRLRKLRPPDGAGACAALPRRSVRRSSRLRCCVRCWRGGAGVSRHANEE